MKLSNIKKAIALLLAFILPACALSGCARDPKLLLDDAVARYNFSGVVRVTVNGEVLCERAEGLADPKTGGRITIDSQFCIGSVSKQFAAACVMLLKQDGKLSVNDTLDKYFPEYPLGKKNTVKSLLTMRSGIAEFYDVEDDGGIYTELPAGTLRGVLTNDGTPEENRKLLRDWLFAQPLEFEPGSRYDYTNSNYFLLAEMVERISGMSYEDFARHRIFEPLNMRHTGFIDEMLDSPMLAKAKREARTVYVGITRGLGDMITNAEDIDLWLASLAGNRLFTDESLAEMSADYSTEGDDSSYGYGIKPDDDGGLYHSGYFTSYFACVYTNPETGYRMFAVTNNLPEAKGRLGDMYWEIIDGTVGLSY